MVSGHNLFSAHTTKDLPIGCNVIFGSVIFFFFFCIVYCNENKLKISVMSSRLPRDEALGKEDRINEIKKKKTGKKKQKTKKNQPIRPAPAASTAGSCPIICQSSRMPRDWKLPSTIARPNHPYKLDRQRNIVAI